MRQLGITLQSFVTDNNFYPLAINPNSDAVTWEIALHNEISVLENRRANVSTWLHQGVWKCPSALPSPVLPKTWDYLNYGYNVYGISSQTNTNSLGLGGHYVWKGSRLSAPPVNESEIASPSEMIAIGDGFVGGGGVVDDGGWTLLRTYGPAGLFHPPADNYAASTRRAYSRHQGKANVVFCDGHVESPTLQFLFEDTSDTALVRWNRDHLPHRERLNP